MAEKDIPTPEAPLALAECYETMARDGDDNPKPRDEAEAKSWEAAGKKYYQAAERNYAAALAAKPNDPAVVSEVVEFYLRTNRLPDAQVQLERFLSGKLKLQPADVLWGRRTLAATLISLGGQKNRERALELIEQNLADPASSGIDRRVHAMVLAAFPSPDKRKEAIRIWEELLAQQHKLQPEDRFSLAQLYFATGAGAKGREQLQSLVLPSCKVPQYVAAYADVLLRNGETAEAGNGSTASFRWRPRASSPRPAKPRCSSSGISGGANMMM